MRKLFRIPLLFLFTASVIGVLLRLLQITPLEGLHYSNLLHTHSHLMFLGWVWNTLLLGFTQNYVDTGRRPFFIRIFWLLQLCNVGMLVSFPLQGYGLYSIIITTVHTLLSFIFIVRFLIITKSDKTVSLLWAKASLIFFLISAAGPFVMPVILSQHLQHTHWYNDAIYFYLHFQYNGVFTFGIMGLFLDSLPLSTNMLPLRRMCKWLFLVTIPMYFLSVLFQDPGVVFNTVGLISAAGQLVAFLFFTKWIHKNKAAIRTKYGHGYSMLIVVFAALLAKCTLQFLSGFPSVAAFASEWRPIIIAYLHLVLVGIISLFLLAWYWAKNMMSHHVAPLFLLFVICFTVMEIILITLPFQLVDGLVTTYGLLFISVLMSLSCLGFLLLFKSNDKSHSIK